MSYPPPPGGPPPPLGGPPPLPGNPFPPQGYPGSQQPWPQQQEWNPGLPPKKRGNGWKWALGAVALLAVIGVTAAVTISVTKDGGSDPTPSGDTFGLASADDKGPANIITEDPSCAAWRPVSQTFADVSNKGWDKRDPDIPAEDWTPEQRSEYEEASQAMRTAADQAVALAKVTPHRVMREFYEQFIAYARAYSDALPTYKPKDDHLARVVTSSSNLLNDVCAAVDWNSAQARAPLIQAPAPPSKVAPLSDPSQPQPFLTEMDPTCEAWDRILNQFNTDSKAWQALNPNIPASNWNVDQRAVVDSAIPMMNENADSIEKLGRSGSNPVIADFAVFAAQYRRAYAAGLPTYTSVDFYLAEAAQRITSTIYEACQAVGG